MSPESPHHRQNTNAVDESWHGSKTAVFDQFRVAVTQRQSHGLFAVDIETCRQCGGRLRVIASIEQPALIDRILAYLGR